MLEHFQKALPSFAGLSKSQQDSIRFTHCHLEETVNLKVQRKVHEVPIPLGSLKIFCLFQRQVACSLPSSFFVFLIVSSCLLHLHRYIFVAIAVQMNAHRTPCPALPREARWITTWAGWPRGFISGRKLALKGT